MRLINLSFAFFFAIQDVHSHFSSSGNHESARWTSNNLSPRSLSDTSSNPCETARAGREAPDADLSCHKECLALKPEISAIFIEYPEYKATMYLYDNCGKVNGGKCSTATNTPTCWCHTLESPENRRTLFNCRTGFQIIRQFANTLNNVSAKSTKTGVNSQHINWETEGDGVNMIQLPNSGPPTAVPKRPRSDHPRRANTNLFTTPEDTSACRPAHPSVPALPPSSPSPLTQLQEEDFNTRPDNQPEGSVLCTDVRVSGNVVRAIVDTGATSSIIHRKFATNVVTLNNQKGTSVSNQQFTILGETTITLEIRKGIGIRLRGFVTDRNFGILLGTDFFVEYRAKMRIKERVMELTLNGTKVTMSIKFRSSPDKSLMISNDRVGYTGLKIVVSLNQMNLKMDIDTGSSITFVSRNLVNVQTLLQTTAMCSFGGNKKVGFLGVTDISLQIGTLSLTVSALVPEFVPTQPIVMGNDFNKQYVELIDYKARQVTLGFHVGSRRYSRITTTAFITEDK